MIRMTADIKRPRDLHLPLLGVLGGLVLLLALAPHVADACTSIAIGPGATELGNTMVSHTVDCLNCDTRVTYIAPRKYADGKRPIQFQVMSYPRLVANDSSPAYSILGHIPADPEHLTYGFYDGAYGLMNEKGLTFGESTCGGNLFTTASEKGPFMGLVPMTQVALERCETARCAIALMGSLAVKYGFYGEDAGPAGAGESLQIGDGKEAWVFHVMSDGTQSAIWAAHKLPDDHIAVVANSFIIRDVRDCVFSGIKKKWNEDHKSSQEVSGMDEEFVESKKGDLMCSTNLKPVAVTEKLWSSGEVFDFARVFGKDATKFQYWPQMPPVPLYMSGRIWRVLSQVANTTSTSSTSSSSSSASGSSLAATSLSESEDVPPRVGLSDADGRFGDVVAISTTTEDSDGDMETELLFGEVPPYDPLVFPFSMKVSPEKVKAFKAKHYGRSGQTSGKITEQVMKDLHRDHYEDTLLDLRKGIVAGPFGSPNRLERGEGLIKRGGQFARAISIPRTTYAWVGSSFDEAKAGTTGMKSRGWFAPDTPASSVFLPLVLPEKASTVPALAECLQRGSRMKVDRKSSFWAFDLVANLMEWNYENMEKNDVSPRIRTWEKKILSQVDTPNFDASRLQNEVTQDWWDFSDFLIAKYNDGFLNLDLKHGGVGQYLGYPIDYLKEVGVDRVPLAKFVQPLAGVDPWGDEDGNARADETTVVIGGGGQGGSSPGDQITPQDKETNDEDQDAFSFSKLADQIQKEAQKIQDAIWASSTSEQDDDSNDNQLTQKIFTSGARNFYQDNKLVKDRNKNMNKDDFDQRRAGAGGDVFMLQEQNQKSTRTRSGFANSKNNKEGSYSSAVMGATERIAHMLFGGVIGAVLAACFFLSSTTTSNSSRTTIMAGRSDHSCTRNLLEQEEEDKKINALCSADHHIEVVGSIRNAEQEEGGSGLPYQRMM
ncbi:unnamed protein product [Amoebophrya sp. A25]|nr:unnamed protein product [Amoebophrya sp. A25]|eukprot:GSA25T00017351001.1